MPRYFKVGIEIDGIDFSHLDMHGVLFDEISLNRACFDGTNLKGAIFNRCAMDHVTFHKTLLQDVRIMKCTLEDSRFHACNMTNISISFSKMTGSQIREVRLRRANLEQSNIAASSLTAVDLRNARLCGTGFIESRISRSHFVGAIAMTADFSDAHITRCRFEYSDLSETSFHNSEFVSCRISKCNVIGTDFSGARFNNCMINDIDFSRALDTDRMKITNAQKGDGCQTETELISNGPKRFQSCFLSYSSLDYEFVNKLSLDLPEHGVLIWLDRKDMSSINWIETSLQKAILSHDVLVLVLSQHAEGRDWVKFETEQARAAGVEIVPVVIDYQIGERQWVKDIMEAGHDTIDFTQWRNEASYLTARALLLKRLANP